MNSTPNRQVRKDVNHVNTPEQVAVVLQEMAKKLQRTAHENTGPDRINILAARKLVLNALDLLPQPENDSL